MLHYLIAVLDNTLPAATALALLLFLAGRGEGARRAFLLGLLPGLGAALVYAVLKRTTGIAVREYYDLGTLLPSLAAAAALPFIAPGIFRRGGGEIPFAGRLCLALLAASWTAAALPDLLLYPPDFFVSMSSPFNAEFLSLVFGYCLGLLLLLLLVASLRALAGTSPPALPAVLFALCLLLVFVSQGLDLIRILLARGMVPRLSWLMSLALLDTRDIFSFAWLSLACLLALPPLLCGGPHAGANPAQRRKSRAALRGRRRLSVLLLGCVLVCALSLTVLRNQENSEAEISPPLAVSPLDGIIALPLETIDDGNLHRFVYTTRGGVGVRFIVIRKSAAAYGVGLDACDICGPTGYYQRKDEVICKLCDVVMNKSTIGFPGGCNPVPLPFFLAGGALRIRAGDLEAEERRFQ
ncbi:MAG: DUF2318 domain-containing protein [Desulfovibrio sp.]|jgi:uncharacterized membrane protein|nr:DUF2318 domain-containing protein [Desulfovibrio sp.]